MQEKLPASVAAYDGLQSYYMASDYIDLYDATGNKADLESARAILDTEMPRMAQLVNYASTLTPSQLNRLGRSESYALQYLGLMTGLRNAVELYSALEGRSDREELLADLPGGLLVPYAQSVYPLIYVSGYTLDEIMANRDKVEGASRQVFDIAARLLELHRALGVNPMAVTDSVVKSNGIDALAWRRLAD